MIRLSVVEERVVLTAVSIVLFMLFGGSALRSPDGMEMLRLTASWLGSSADVGDPSFWPPLWSLLNVPAVSLGYDTAGARLLNLLCWGALVWPLHSLACGLSTPRAGRIAVAVYWMVPIFFAHAAVLDARPLGALITTTFFAASVAAVQGRRGVAVVAVLAAMAPFARPEGILLPVLTAGVAWMAGRGVARSVMLAGLSVVPHAVFRSSLRGLSGHEQLYGAWYTTWSTWDILSLFGPASVPTEFRRFALAAVESGKVPGQPAIDDVVALVATMPGGVVGAIGIMAGTVGVMGMAAAVRGLLSMPRDATFWTIAVLVGSPLLIVAITPMAKDQASAAANYLFVVPGLIALLATGIDSLRSPRWVAVCFGLLMAEVHLTPLAHEPPYFLEGSEAAALAAQMLVTSGPASGVVGADFSSRDVVFRAGMKVRAIGPIWAGPVPDDVDAIMINSVGAKGEDGGRTIQLLESPDWRVEWVVGDGDVALARGERPEMPRPERGWYALLRRR